MGLAPAIGGQETVIGSRDGHHWEMVIKIIASWESGLRQPDGWASLCRKPEHKEAGDESKKIIKEREHRMNEKRETNTLGALMIEREARIKKMMRISRGLLKSRANYRGKCPFCKDVINPGDKIIFANKVWICAKHQLVSATPQRKD
jgi:hypothetical protein